MGDRQMAGCVLLCALTLVLLAASIVLGALVGVPIHVGDVLDGYSKTIEVVELRYGRSGWVLISRDGNAYADCAAFTHHHAPTVEDVLAEMLDAWGELPSNATNEAIVAEYAAKLRLAEGSE